MKREDDQALWDLLGKTSQSQLSPFFARNVLRAIRSEDEPPTHLSPRIGTWFSLKRLLPVTGIAVALLAVVLLTHSPFTVPGVPRTPSEAPVLNRASQEADLAADIDDLAGEDVDDSDLAADESLF